MLLQAHLDVLTEMYKEHWLTNQKMSEYPHFQCCICWRIVLANQGKVSHLEYYYL